MDPRFRWVSVLAGCHLLASGCGDERGGSPSADAQDIPPEADATDVVPDPDAIWQELYGDWVPWEDDFVVPEDAGPPSTRQTARPLGTVAGAPNGYLEYLPPGYGVRPPPPLLVFWHGQTQWGSGEDEESLARVRLEGPPSLIAADRWPNTLPFVVLSPQRRANICCPPASEVRDFFAFALARYAVDRDRIYLTGLSAGAIGSWNYLAEELDGLVDGAVLIAGDGRGAWNRAGCALGRVRVWAFHGSEDHNVQVEGSIVPLNALRACTDPPPFDARLTVYEGMAHDVWTRTYDMAAGNDIYAWLLSDRITPPSTDWLQDDWTCLGQVEWEPSPTETVTIEIDLRDLPTTEAFSASVDACAREDVACASPLDSARTVPYSMPWYDVPTSYARLTIPTPGVGFDGFLRVTPDEVSVETYVWPLPPVHEGLFPWSGPYETYSAEALRETAAQAGIALDMSRAHVMVLRSACGYLGTHGGNGTYEIEVTLDGRAPDPIPEEVRGCTGNATCVEWFFDVEPGPVSVEARLHFSEELVGRVDAHVWAGGLTYLIVGPTPLE